MPPPQSLISSQRLQAQIRRCAPVHQVGRRGVHGAVLAVGVFLVVTVLFNERIVRADMVLCLLVFALTFPGRNPIRERSLLVGVDIALSWAAVLGIWRCSDT